MRPWNTRLKKLCFLIGESFVKVSGKDDAYYGQVYNERRIYEDAKNKNLDYKDQADEKLKTIGKSTEAYKSYVKGMLPDGHLYMRAKRYAVKLFLSHYHAQGFRLLLGKEPPVPFPIAHLGHIHLKEIPHLD